MSRVLRAIRMHGYLTAVAAVGGATLLFYPGRDTFAKGQWALLYLLIIVVVASLSGIGPALLAAVLAFFAWNYFFLPPYHTLTVADAKDWLSLLAFLVVGLLMGLQTGRLRQRELRALAREREASFLNRISSSLVSEPAPEVMAHTVVTETFDLLGVAHVALYAVDAGRPRLLAAQPEQDDDEGLRRAERALSAAVPAATAGERRLALPIDAAGRRRGVLLLDTGSQRAPVTESEAQLVRSLGNLVAAFLEQQELEAAASRAEAAREADRLKSTLLSSVSHELKTPLSGLTATLSNLLESDVAWDEQGVRMELGAIVADVQRLTNSINALLDLSRLEADSWQPQPDWYDVRDLMVASLGTLPLAQRARVEVRIPDDLPALHVDFAQLVRVFQSLLENALLYAGPRCAVRFAAAASPVGVTVWVEDDGPGVPPDERERVFDKFYRGRGLGPTAPSGTGLGLAIAAEIVHAHAGTLRLDPVEPHGARFSVDLGRAP